jgi:hypothetical protein
VRGVVDSRSRRCLHTFQSIHLETLESLQCLRNWSSTRGIWLGNLLTDLSGKHAARTAPSSDDNQIKLIQIRKRLLISHSVNCPIESSKSISNKLGLVRNRASQVRGSNSSNLAAALVTTRRCLATLPLPLPTTLLLFRLYCHRRSGSFTQGRHDLYGLKKQLR